LFALRSGKAVRQQRFQLFAIDHGGLLDPDYATRVPTFLTETRRSPGAEYFAPPGNSRIARGRLGPDCLRLRVFERARGLQ
jgi:hypothetical protein